MGLRRKSTGFLHSCEQGFKTRGLSAHCLLHLHFHILLDRHLQFVSMLQFDLCRVSSVGRATALNHTSALSETMDVEPFKFGES